MDHRGVVEAVSSGWEAGQAHDIKRGEDRLR